MAKQLDWNAVAERAARMSAEELHGACMDAFQAALAARALERAGLAVEKTEGYYMDEISVYRTEQRRRAEVK